MCRKTLCGLRKREITEYSFAEKLEKTAKTVYVILFMQIILNNCKERCFSWIILN